VRRSSETRARDIITIDSVIKAVAGYYGLKPSDIKSERRHKSVATPRAVAYISRKAKPDTSLTARSLYNRERSLTGQSKDIRSGTSLIAVRANCETHGGHQVRSRAQVER
jgi:hypothetical protein